MGLEMSSIPLCEAAASSFVLDFLLMLAPHHYVHLTTMEPLCVSVWL